jgi:predicted DNA-binding transcriptional regulator YafY
MVLMVLNFLFSSDGSRDGDDPHERECYAATSETVVGLMGQDTKSVALLKLARRLAATAHGLTLDEMAVELDCDRRTADRYRRDVELLFPQLISAQDGQEKRFHIPGGLDSIFQTPNTEELLELTKTIEELKTKGTSGLVRARCLEDLKDKVCAAMKKAMNKVAPDLDVLMQSEMIAVRAGARRLGNPETLKLIRQAILSMKALRFVYLKGTKPGVARTVTPYGVIFDHSAWLVAAEEDETLIKTYRLDEMQAMEILKQDSARPEDFSLADYAGESFGLFHGEQQDVVLHVLPAALDREGKLHWQFHQSQTIEYLSDNQGALVRFRATGMKELMWHLFAWGNDVQIVAPEKLRLTLITELIVARDWHEAEPRYLQKKKIGHEE